MKIAFLSISFCVVFINSVISMEIQTQDALQLDLKYCVKDDEKTSEDITCLANALPKSSLSSLNLENVTPVSMNGYSQTSDDTLITTGVNDCVVMAFYLPSNEEGKGKIYLGHFLRINEFTPGQDACTFEEKGDCQQVRLMDFIEIKGSKAKTIKDSLPSWVNDEKVICYIFSQAANRLNIRKQQLLESGFKGKIISLYGSVLNVPCEEYFSEYPLMLENCQNDKEFNRSFLPENFKPMWDESKQTNILGVGITPNGDFFMLNETEPYQLPMKFRYMEVFNMRNILEQRLERRLSTKIYPQEKVEVDEEDEN